MSSIHQRTVLCTLVGERVRQYRQRLEPVSGIGSAAVHLQYDYGCERENECLWAGRLPACPLQALRG
jgi:hypothetical protein